MPVGIFYNLTYLHKRKEVVVNLKVGSMPPIEFVMGAEAFIQDLDYIRKDKAMAGMVEGIRQRKDLPIDHDFGAGGSDFDKSKWDNMMGDKDGKDD